ncbi:TPA: hypothetical protein DEP34_01840 [Candidatus Uhrbacteria bacterium]|uniref:MazG nucleotide pyrophosphohydrolase n=2 Tax=Candidatus Uhriibacteriota TaxID=1752732 RepID=A0A0G1Q9E3_9BACT|nr:MAG: MazG nucleotide pyrophosphohydrolase [Candidatus Uhrbacteria bacterium GW2011_GWF2_46_218]KKU41666.1 MAG: MazG nucleotide pyrophosphohydrolase [Candidatus Uhrbacteria bacterium GW2011_GWE2_46_68]HBK33464.1 hypothetical protein [Candidatus Uhrbacteria bacterium]HCB19109.1 hypothetical protein [Candidatus Uhrbacteria bacterium]
MQFSDYQTASWKTATYPHAGENLYYAALGLGGEAGEMLNKIKKIIRDHDSVLTDDYRELCKAELGDVLWYVAALATELHIDLETVAQDNINKLTSRQERGTLGGSGDVR